LRQGASLLKLGIREEAGFVEIETEDFVMAVKGPGTLENLRLVTVV